MKKKDANKLLIFVRLNSQIIKKLINYILGFESDWVIGIKNKQNKFSRAIFIET